MLYGSIHTKKSTLFVTDSMDYSHLSNKSPFSVYTPHTSDELANIYKKYTDEYETQARVRKEVHFVVRTPAEIGAALSEQNFKFPCPCCEKISSVIMFTTWLKRSENSLKMSSRTHVDSRHASQRSLNEKALETLDQKAKWYILRFVNVQSGEVYYAHTSSVAMLLLLLALDAVDHPFDGKNKMWIFTSFLAQTGGLQHAKQIVEYWASKEPPGKEALPFSDAARVRHSSTIKCVAAHFNLMETQKAQQILTQSESRPREEAFALNSKTAAKGKTRESKVSTPGAKASLSSSTHNLTTIYEFVISEAFSGKVPISVPRFNVPGF